MELQQPARTDVGREMRRAALAAINFLVIASLAMFDLAGDLREGTTPQHVIVEGFIALAGVVGLWLLLRRFRELRQRERDARAEAAELGHRLRLSEEEGARWRAEAKDLLAGLGALIEKQFQRWGLTPAEREVALLLLKGLSHREIAAARAVSEATVRQQAAVVYRKAGLSGRHDLAAFFLEDLLAPRSQV